MELTIPCLQSTLAPNTEQAPLQKPRMEGGWVAGEEEVDCMNATLMGTEYAA